MKLVTMILAISFGLLSCKSIKSHEYGVLSDSTREEGLYYFKLFEGDTLKNIIEKNKEYLSRDKKLTAYNQYSNELDNIKSYVEDCIVCRFTCTVKNEMKIDSTNVTNVCNQDPRYVPCSRVGFNNESKTYNNLKEALTSEDVVVKLVDQKSLYDYFEERLELYDSKYDQYYSNWFMVGASRYLCPVDSTLNSLVSIYSNKWEEIEEGKIYMLVDKSQGSSWANYYHATDGKLHSIRNENPFQLCSQLNNKETIQGYKTPWYPIQSANFDYVNEKKMAVSISRRMNLGSKQCFITYAQNGNGYSYVLKSFADDRDCSKETSGRLICVAYTAK